MSTNENDQDGTPENTEQESQHEHEHEHEQEQEQEHRHQQWSLNIEMTGDSPELLIEALADAMLPMLENGFQHFAAKSVTTGVDAHLMLKPTIQRGIYLDGEGTLVAVDDDGDVATLVNRDGVEDETAGQLLMSAHEWAKAHGGLNRPGEGDLEPSFSQLKFMTSKTVGGLSEMIGRALGVRVDFQELDLSDEDSERDQDKPE